MDDTRCYQNAISAYSSQKIEYLRHSVVVHLALPTASNGLQCVQNHGLFNGLLAQALGKGKLRRNQGKSHWAIAGPTINGKGFVKDAVLRIANHSVLKRIRERLVASIRNQHDHYVIISERKMRGIGRTSCDQKTRLHSLFDELGGEYHHLIREWTDNAIIPVRPSADRFWYQYYEGDLNRLIKINDGQSEYVRISSG